MCIPTAGRAFRLTPRKKETPSSEDAYEHERKTGGSVHRGKGQGAVGRWSLSCLKSEASTFTENERAGGDTAVSRAEALQRVRTSTTAFICQLSRTDRIRGSPRFSLVTAILPAPGSIIACLESQAGGCVFVCLCVCAPNSEAASKAEAMGALDSFRSIHFYWVPDVC